jgi:16S rRNA G1207 methylase RsmC
MQNNNDLIPMKIPGIDLAIQTNEQYNNYVKVVRDDGLTVFYDKHNDEISCVLNKIRQTAPSDKVIAAVGVVRGLQTARNYASRYGKASDIEAIDKLIEQFVNEYKHIEAQ